LNRLAHTRCYLAGAIEKVMHEDGGFTWRQKVKKDLKHLKINWLDPTCKPTSYGIESPETWKDLTDAREKENLASVRAMMFPICKVDLRMVDISDFIIVDIDPKIPTFGTHEEVGRAMSQNKPVLVRVEGGVKNAPFWWFERLDPRWFFGTWEELYQFLNDLSTVNLTDEELLTWSGYKWLFFDWMGEKD